MNNLPTVVTQQRRGRASNPRLLDRKSDALPLSHRATFLLPLMAKDKTFIWGKEQQDAFEELKNKLCNPPILRFPDSHWEYFLETDASIEGISYILGQRDEGGHKYVVSYGGRGLRPCERRWPVTQLECLALLTGIKEYHVYLAGRPFSVYTDQS